MEGTKGVSALHAPSVDYEAGSIALDNASFLLARGRAGQISIIDLVRRRVVGNAVVGEDGAVMWSNELAERVIKSWLAYCSLNDLDPWPRPASRR